MIGNLGKVDYVSVSRYDENSGNSGNRACGHALVQNQGNGSLFSCDKNCPTAAGTRQTSLRPVPGVLEDLDLTGNQSSECEKADRLTFIEAVPEVPAVPERNGDPTDNPVHPLGPKGRIYRNQADIGERADTIIERKPCYCCNGTDYWLGGTKKHPHWVCRKCHPPSQGAERKPVKI